MSMPEPAPKVLTILEAAALAEEEVPEVELLLDVEDVEVVLVDVVEEETAVVAMVVYWMTAI